MPNGEIIRDGTKTIIMYKSLTIVLIIILSAFHTVAQTTKELFLQVQKSKPDINQVKLLVQLGEMYMDEVSHTKADLDSAIVTLNRALQLSRHLHSAEWQRESVLHIGRYYANTNRLDRGMDSVMQVINYYHKNELWAKEAYTWDYLSQKCIINNTELRVSCSGHALALYKKAGDRNNVGSMHMSIGSIYYDQGKFDQAENELQLALAENKAIGVNKNHPIYSWLALIYQQRGAPQKELFYRLEAVKNMEALGDTVDAGYNYYLLAYTYKNVDNLEQSLFYYKKALNAYQRAGKSDDFYSSAGQVADVLLQLKKNKEAIDIFQKLSTKFPPKNDKQRRQLNNITFNIYKNTGQFKKLDLFIPIYLEASKNSMPEADRLDNGVMLNRFLGDLLRVANYYSDTRQYKNAAALIGEMRALPQKRILPAALQQMYSLQFKVDSASGNYVSAIQNLQKYNTIRDSIYTTTKSKQIADINIKYETEKKEQAIKILQGREQQAILQRNFNQAKLQKVSLQRDVQAGELQKAGLQRSIQEGKLQKIELQRNVQAAELQKAALLRNIQQSALQKANMERNITFGGLTLLLIMAGLAYNGYRNKKQSNKVLQVKQGEINEQNETLQHLLSEKEWLLKEVHHRVKNNLQIVMSLLNSQSAYLENKAAIEAIRESQNRVQAISLIHQKLYSGNNVASINMRAYVADLINYLADSFDTGKRGIRFEQLVEPFNLDLAQAVPLGLILNESVTNAIKYAFGTDGGQVIVALQLIRDESLLLTIVDNGKGLPVDFDLKTASSLGMEMMKALSKQLGGEFQIKNSAGVNISIEFAIEKMHSHPHSENIYN